MKKITKVLALLAVMFTALSFTSCINMITQAMGEFYYEGGDYELLVMETSSLDKGSLILYKAPDLSSSFASYYADNSADSSSPKKDVDVSPTNIYKLNVNTWSTSAGDCPEVTIEFVTKRKALLTVGQETVSLKRSTVYSYFYSQIIN